MVVEFDHPRGPQSRITRVMSAKEAEPAGGWVIDR
jgi:hypothetical protein